VRFSAADGFSLDGPQATVSGGLEADYRAAMTGLRDYVEANRFPGVVLGLSGGIDSALVAAICADALGPQRVWCVMMPSRFTASQSRTDAEACAQALGVRYDTVAIGEGMAALDGMLGPLFAGTARGVAEENIQSRLRGMTLMALSNRFGPMVVSTGNKSELATGYATLYGDMAGGYNPLKDIWKTEVFALARWRNVHVPRGGMGPGGEVIPQAIIDRPPTAELREDQTDEAALAPYPVLDGILRRLVDEDQSVADVIAAGFDAGLVHRIEGLLYVAEYKRRQGAPGPKIGRKHFGRDRRYPITNDWRDRGKPTGD
jgi:NAD+ synthase